MDPYHGIRVLHREGTLNPVTKSKYISLTFFFHNFLVTEEKVRFSLTCPCPWYPSFAIETVPTTVLLLIYLFFKSEISSRLFR